jgi:hypothetical protein
VPRAAPSKSSGGSCAAAYQPFSGRSGGREQSRTRRRPRTGRPGSGSANGYRARTRACAGDNHFPSGEGHYGAFGANIRSPKSYTVETIKGVSYARVDAVTGGCQATYS